MLLQDAQLESQQSLTKVSIDVIMEVQRKQREEAEREKKKKEKILKVRGINPLEHMEDTFS